VERFDDSAGDVIGALKSKIPRRRRHTIDDSKRFIEFSERAINSAPIFPASRAADENRSHVNSLVIDSCKKKIESNVGVATGRLVVSSPAPLAKELSNLGALIDWRRTPHA
jgi:hypothetical protein